MSPIFPQEDGNRVTFIDFLIETITWFDILSAYARNAPAGLVDFAKDKWINEELVAQKTGKFK